MKIIPILEAQADEHARLSPSAAKGWWECAGRIALEARYPDRGNRASDRGTALHYIAKVCLLESVRAHQFIDQEVPVHKPGQEPRTYEFTEADSDIVQDYVDTILSMARGCELRVEQKIDFSHAVGVPGQFGTGDAVIADTKNRELIVADLKTGYHYVEVAENKQLMIYAVGVMIEMGMAYEFDTVRLCIYQPDHGGMREWVTTVADLEAFALELKVRGQRVLQAEAMLKDVGHVEEFKDWAAQFLNPNPNEEACAWCRAMADCPSQRAKLERVVQADFDRPDSVKLALQRLVALDDAELAAMMQSVGHLEDFCIAVRASLEQRLIAANNDPALVERLGFGLELGRQGPRKWGDPVEAEALLRDTLKLADEHIYNKKLRSPTQVEALKKQRVVTDEDLAKLAVVITRSDPKPSVKPLGAIKTLWVPENAGPTADAFSIVGDAD